MDGDLWARTRGMGMEPTTATNIAKQSGKRQYQGKRKEGAQSGKEENENAQ